MDEEPRDVYPATGPPRTWWDKEKRSLIVEQSRFPGSRDMVLLRINDARRIDAIPDTAELLTTAAPTFATNLLRTIAAGRAEYAGGAPPHHAQILLAEAGTLELAAKILEEPHRARLLIPSWRTLPNLADDARVTFAKALWDYEQRGVTEQIAWGDLSRCTQARFLERADAAIEAQRAALAAPPEPKES